MPERAGIDDRRVAGREVCGEMTGDAMMTRLLLGFGLRHFSMHPAHVLAVKRQVLQSSLPELTAITRRILGSYDIDRIEPLLEKLNLH